MEAVFPTDSFLWRFMGGMVGTLLEAVVNTSSKGRLRLATTEGEDALSGFRCEETRELYVCLTCMVNALERDESL